MMTDPIADLLIQIKNGYMSGKDKITLPFSRQKEEIVNLLVKEGFIAKKVEKKDGETKRLLELTLVYKGKKSRLSNILRISKPGKRVYVKSTEVPTVLGGLGLVIISTPKGMLTGIDAKKERVGGELICKLW